MLILIDKPNGRTALEPTVNLLVIVLADDPSAWADRARR
jgi:hypothetical protein